MPLNRIPGAEEFAAYRATNPNFAEIVRQPLYDWQLYATAGQQQLLFFQTPIGQGITTALGATVGQPKSQSDTNMTNNGMLPSGLRFLAEAIEVGFYPGSVSTASTYTPATITAFAATAAATVAAANFNDPNTFYQSGLLEFNVLAKNYLRDTPLIKFVPQVTFGVDAAASNTSTTTGLYAVGTTKPVGDPYWLEPPVALFATEAFNVTLNWPAVVATPSGFNARVGVTLQGFTYRAGQ